MDWGLSVTRVEPSSNWIHTPGEPTRNSGRRFTSQPSQRPPRRYDPTATAAGTYIQVGGQ